MCTSVGTTDTAYQVLDSAWGIQWGVIGALLSCAANACRRRVAAWHQHGALCSVHTRALGRREQVPHLTPVLHGWVGREQICHTINLFGFYASNRHGARHHYYNSEVPSNVERDDNEYQMVMDHWVKRGRVNFGDPCVTECHANKEACETCMGCALYPPCSRARKTRVRAAGSRHRCDLGPWPLSADGDSSGSSGPSTAAPLRSIPCPKRSAWPVGLLRAAMRGCGPEVR